MKEIIGTWNGRTGLIQSNQSRTGFFIVNTTPYPFGQFRTRVYVSDIMGIVVDWKPVYDYKMDVFDRLITQLELKEKKDEPKVVKIENEDIPVEQKPIKKKQGKVNRGDN